MTDEEFCEKMMSGFAEGYARGTIDWATYLRLRDNLFEWYDEDPPPPGG